jgi:hypothetical protein
VSSPIKESRVREKHQTIDTLAEEQLPEQIKHAIHGIELSVTIQENSVHIVLHRTSLELKAVLNWGVVVVLALGLMKLCKDIKLWF